MNKNSLVIKSILKKNNPNILKSYQIENKHIEEFIIQKTDFNETYNDYIVKLPLTFKEFLQEHEIQSIQSIQENEIQSIQEPIIKITPEINLQFIEEKLKIQYKSYHDFIKFNPDYIYNQLIYSRLLSKKKFIKHYKF